jgi:uncharacterized protein YqcC (DUF446 family)
MSSLQISWSGVSWVQWITISALFVPNLYTTLEQGESMLKNDSVRQRVSEQYIQNAQDIIKTIDHIKNQDKGMNLSMIYLI